LPGPVHRLVYDTYSEDRLRLLGYCLSDKLTVLKEYRTAYIALTQDELKRSTTRWVTQKGCQLCPVDRRDTAAILLTERTDRIRISFRSKGDFSVNTLAREHFSGGGHLNAAGGDSFESMEATILKLYKILAQYKISSTVA